MTSNMNEKERQWKKKFKMENIRRELKIVCMCRKQAIFRWV